GDQLRIAPAFSFIAFDDRVYCGVGHALGGTNYSRAYFIADNLAAMVDLHEAGHHQSIQMGAQAADVGGKFQRQHGHGAIGEVNAGAAQARFLIERRIRSDVVGDVGDVHLQLEVAVFEAGNEHGIVEVASAFSVDGDNRQVAKVAPLAQLGGGDDGLDGLGFIQDFRRKPVREMEFADNDLDVDAEILFIA